MQNQILSLKMNYYNIGSYQYSLFFENNILIIKAVEFNRLANYKVEITNDTVSNTRFVDNLHELNKILNNCFRLYSRSPKNDPILVIKKQYIKLLYNRKKDFIHIVLRINSEHNPEQEILEFYMTNNEYFVNQQKTNDKIQNVDPKKQFLIISILTETIALTKRFLINSELMGTINILTDQLSKLKYIGDPTKQSLINSELEGTIDILTNQLSKLKYIDGPTVIYLNPHTSMPVDTTYLHLYDQRYRTHKKCVSNIEESMQQEGRMQIYFYKNIQSLKFFTKLSQLWIEQTDKIKSWCPIYGLPLTKLALSDCNLDDNTLISIIQASIWKNKLVYLNISYNKNITKLKFLKFLPKLIEANCAHDGMDDNLLED